VNERDVARELLRELLDGALAHRGGHANGNGGGHGDGHGDPPPQVPPPPVAAVLRPGGQAHAQDRTERVTLASDADLDRFVRALADRLEDPAERAAVRSGRLRFTLNGGGGHGGQGGRGARGARAAGPPGTVRVDRGAVTERTVAQAARDGARLVLGPRAVLTPLAREKARAAGVEIEREQPC
jgi:hypothetical protein